MIALLLLMQGILLPLVIAQDGPVVSTKYGQVEGESKETKDGNAYDEFRGIPFGAPTSGNMRWQKPAEPEPWEGILSAKEYGRTCPQLVLFWTREDCLSVNVYVPDGVEQHTGDPLPVMVWIYGGAFILGAARTYNGQLLATRGRVVVVTFNYRVGTMGFLSTGSDAAPGNYGLWDQVAVLRWVNENIASFGGDADRVTIVGQSAGAASASHLSLAPAARGLFHRVIALSGSSTSVFGQTTRQPMTTRNLARYYGCPEDSDEAMVDCLREEDAISLSINGLLVPLTVHGYFPNYNPVVDGELVTRTPVEAMEQGLNCDYDLLSGRTYDDGSLFSLPFSGTVESFRQFLTSFFNPWENNEELVQMVFEQYPDLESDDPLVRDQAGSQFMTDFAFGHVAYQEVGYHSENAASSGKNTYFYEYDYQYLFRSSWIRGMHLEDVLFFLGDYSSWFLFTEEDKALSRNIQSYYCNFAYTGNPNEGPHSVPTEWPKYDTTNKMQMRQSREMTVESVSEEVLARYNWWFEEFFPKTIPREEPDSSNLNRSDMEELHRRLSVLTEKFTHMDLDDPFILRSVFEVFMETQTS